MADNNFTWAVGRRKSAVARIKISKGSGKITVNKGAIEAYFVEEAYRAIALQSLVTSGLAGQYDFFITVKGGGRAGQAGALRHGIARALVAVQEDVKPVLKAAGFMTRDSRVKERLKPGQPGARKRFQFSKR